MYNPPVYGSCAPISAIVSPAVKVITPPTTQANNAIVDDPALSKTDPCLKKIPEPITVPTTNANADHKPNDRFNSMSSFTRETSSK